MKTFRRSSLVMISIAATAACTQDAANTGGSNENLGPGTIVTVNGERIPESLFRIYVLNALQRNPDELTPAEREQATEDLVRFKLLEAEAIERGLPGERTVAAELELQRLNLLARSMALRYIEENPATD